jgi:hypothetical protein
MGKMKVVIDSGYPLSLVADAHEYVELGNEKGNTVLLFRLTMKVSDYTSGN